MIPLKTQLQRYPILFIWPAILLILSSCNNFKRNKSHAAVPLSNIKSGKALAAVYCQSCHQLPDPSSLDAKSWANGVLPNMGPYLGIFNLGFQEYPSSRNDRFLDKGFYPSHPLLNNTEWQHIIDYYTATSPDTLPAQSRTKNISLDIPGFKIVVPPDDENPAVTFITVDTSSAQHQLLLYDISRKSLLSYNSKLQKEDTIVFKTPVVAASFKKEALAFCNIGEINPNNGRSGKLQSFFQDENGHLHPDSLLVIDSLARPVDFQAADLNGDGRTDYLVSEFGHLKGELAWFEDTGEHRFKKHILRNLPGAGTTVINDYNHDGQPDIWALFAQADEGIFLFTNKGHGLFETQRLLSFPPMQGSTGIELDDFNKDGFPDILYTCGDNADFSSVLKPYHGVYIFLNDGKNKFTENYFFPVHGCFKAIARDFDRDGDLDIAAISFFADDPRQPEEGFVYLKNEGQLRFNPFSFPQSRAGKWLTMNEGDLDRDGKIDIVLGNFSAPVKSKHTFGSNNKGPEFIFLKNISQ
jgi:hypothetical protein